MSEFIGNIRKMWSEYKSPINYTLPLYNNLEKGEYLDVNSLIGKDISIEFDGMINCVVTGRKVKKTYGEGMCFDAFRKSPLAVESIIRPELSQAHLGIALRDLEWEKKHDIQPHLVYLSLTSNVKVGVTRKTQMPYRWIDQGAVQALILAETPYRQAAGLLEVSLKEHVSDRTNWRKMLANEYDVSVNLLNEAKSLGKLVPEELKKFLIKDTEVVNLNFPVLQYPKKITSLKLDKSPLIQKKLVGIKGQYFLFDDDTVLNIRSHTGYKVYLNF